MCLDKTDTKWAMSRWGIQRGSSVVPKSTNHQHQKELMDIFDWELSSQQLQTLNSIEPQVQLLASVCCSPSQLAEQGCCLEPNLLQVLPTQSMAMSTCMMRDVAPCTSLLPAWLPDHSQNNAVQARYLSGEFFLNPKNGVYKTLDELWDGEISDVNRKVATQAMKESGQL